MSPVLMPARRASEMEALSWAKKAFGFDEEGAGETEATLIFVLSGMAAGRSHTAQRT